MAITYHNIASNPSDGGSNATSPVAITPPGSMANKDLVVVVVNTRNASDTIAVSEAGGQSWTSLTAQTNTQQTTRWFYCIFDGTWDANPSFSFGGTNGTAMMMVFRPTSGMSWEVDVAESPATIAAPSTPFDVTITGITCASASVMIASFCSRDDNTWVYQSGGATAPAGSSVNNLAGNDTATQMVYKLMPSGGSTGNQVSRQTTNGGDTGCSNIMSFKEVVAKSYITANETITFSTGAALKGKGKLTSASASGALETNLKSHWKMDEASGNVSDDLGNHNSTNVVGTPTYNQDGKLGKSILLGNTIYFLLADHNDFSLLTTDDASFQAWIYATDWGLTSAYKIIFGATDYGFYLYQSSGGSITMRTRFGTIYSISDGFTLNTNTWYHFVWVKQTDGVSFYKDGSLVSKDTVNIPENADPTTIAIGSVSSGHYAVARFDDLAYWKGKALTSTEVSELWNGGNGKAYPWSQATIQFSASGTLSQAANKVYGTGNVTISFTQAGVLKGKGKLSSLIDSLNQGLIAHWKMNESSGQIIDSHGSHNSNSINGTPDYSQSGKLGTSIGFVETEAIWFNDSTDWSIGSTDKVSVNAWVYVSIDKNGDQYIEIIGTGGVAGTFFLNSHATDAWKYCLGYYDGVTSKYSNYITITPNIWHMFTWVKKESSMSFYKDGSFINEATGVSWASVDPSVWLLLSTTNGYGLTGRLDSISYWKNKALTDDEVSQLFNSNNALDYPFVQASIKFSAYGTLKGKGKLTSSFGEGTLDTGVTGHWKFNESSGHVYDSVGSHNSNIEEDLTYGEPGKIGTSIKLNTVGRIVIPDSTDWDLGLTEDASYSMWINLHTHKTDWNAQRIITGDLFNIALERNDVAGQYIAKFSNTTDTTVYAAEDYRSFSLDTWYHFALVKKSNTQVDFYLNGSLWQSMTGLTMGSFSATSWSFGGSAGGYFGKFDSFTYWKGRALTATDIVQLYNSGNGRDYPFGQAAITFSASGTLAAKGAKVYGSGNETITFSQAGVLKGRGKLSGAPQITFSQAGILKGKGKLSTSTNIEFTQAGILKGKGKLYGLTNIDFTQAGILKGRGKLSGAPQITFSQSGILKGHGKLSALTDIQFTQAGVLKGRGKLYGSTNINLTQAGILRGKGKLYGATEVEFEFITQPALKGRGKLSTSTIIQFTQAGVLKGKGKLYGSSQITFDTSASLDYASLPGQISGSATVTFSRSAVLKGKGKLTGADSILFTQTGALKGRGKLSGSSLIEFSQTGSLKGKGKLSGSELIAFTQSAILRAKGKLAGSTSVIFGVSADLGFVVSEGQLIGQTLIQFSTAGSLKGKGRLFGSTQIVFTVSPVLHIIVRRTGSATIVFSQSGNLQAKVSIANITGQSVIVFSQAGQIHGHGKLVGSTVVSATASGIIGGIGKLLGQSAITFFAEADIHRQGFLAGVSDIAFDAHGNLRMAALYHEKICGLSLITISIIGDSPMCNQISGESAITGTIEANSLIDVKNEQCIY